MLMTYVLLFVGAILAAAISGAAGFGGALLLLPLLTHTVGATLAVPLLTVAQLIGNVSRALLGWRQIRWSPVVLFCLGAVPCSVLGSLSFVALPKALVVRLIGAGILTFVALRAVGRLHVKPGRLLLVGGGAGVGFLSGLVGSAGPLGAAIFLSLNLPAVAYISSEATTALIMHAVKIVVYQQALRLDPEVWLLATCLGAAMVLGTWVGKHLIERLPAAWFRRFVTALLVMVSVQMLLFG